MTHELNTDDFDEVLQSEFGVNSDELLTRIDQTSREYEAQMDKWRAFLSNAKEELIMSQAPPIQILKQLDMICQYEELVDSEADGTPRPLQMCQQFKKWKTDRQSIANMLDMLHLVKEIPPEGLDNQEIEGVLQSFANTFGGVQLFKVETRDFMFCDVEKRFYDPTYPSITEMQLINQNIQNVDSQGTFKRLETGLLEGSVFGRLTGPTIAQMYADGVDLIGIIINTAACDASGTHWVAFVIDIEKRSIELFDSTGEYKRELRPVLEFGKFLAVECSSIFGKQYDFVYHDKQVQEDTNTCGVFSLFYIYARILGVEPQRILQALESRNGNNYIRMFKRILFA